MKLERDTGSGVVVTGIGDGEIRLGESIIRAPVILMIDRIIADWNPPGPEALTIEHLGPALEMQPELIIIGTGSEQRFLAPRVATAILERGIGLEVMATRPACRTYNVLVAEYRRVVAALYPP